MIPPDAEYLTALRTILDKRFDDGELRTLCFDLDVPYDSLSGGGSADKARELVAYCHRHGRLNDLISVGRRQRPEITWPLLPQETPSRPEPTARSAEPMAQLEPTRRNLIDLLIDLIKSPLFQGLCALAALLGFILGGEWVRILSIVVLGICVCLLILRSGIGTWMRRNWKLGLGLAVSFIAGGLISAFMFRDDFEKATLTPTPVPIPQGHDLYDDFTAADALEANWRVDNRPQGKLCQLRLGEGKLYFNCVNPDPNNDVSVTLPPIMRGSLMAGLAVAVKVERGGAFQLATNWRCMTDGAERAYQMELDFGDPVKLMQFSPPNLTPTWFGRASVLPTQPHILQIERSDSGLAFFVDSQPISLTQAPDFPSCLEMNDWSLEFYVRRNSTVQGWIDWVSTRNPVRETVLFEDDFEKGASPQWTTSGSETWQTRPDPKKPGNTIYCIQSKSNHNYALVGSAEWRNYALQFDLYMLQYGKAQTKTNPDEYGGLATVYTIFAPESKFYDYTFAKNKAALIRYAQDPQSNTFQLQNYGLGLTNKTAIPEQWHTIRIEVRESGFKVFQDRDLVMLGSDPFPIAQGSIRLGAVPDSEVCFDNVKVTALPTGTPTLTAPTTSTSTGSLDFRLASSTFQEDAEGWTIEGAGIGPSWERGGGNPGGFISGDDSFIEAADWFWVAPEKFTGDLSAAYGGTIFFDLSQNVRNKQITTTNDVILQGAMVTLFYDIDNPGREWRPYALWLHELGGWKNSEGRPATQGEMRSVLSSLKKIMIRGDFSDGGETIGLDNVMLVRRPGSGD